MSDLNSEANQLSIVKWKEYPSYRNYKLKFIRPIPEHWNVLPLKRIASLGSGAGFPEEFQGIGDEELPFYKVEDMNLPGNEVFMCQHAHSVSQTTASKLGATVFKSGSTIFPKVGAALLTNKRRILTTPACLDNNLMGAFPQIINGNYLYYFMTTVDMDYWANPGAVPSVTQRDINNLWVFMPSSNEQNVIAAFLDEHTAKIDALIAKKQRLIELLNEKRAAIISRAVTKGLDPSVPMKESGIEWLGEIPRHWEVVPLVWYLKIASGGAADIAKDSSDTMSVPVIGGNGFMGYTSNSNAPPNALAVGRVGEYCGNIHLISEPAWITDNALIISDIRCFTRNYLLHLLRTSNLNGLAARNAQPLVTGTLVKRQKAPLPPQEEQNVIVAHINDKISTIGYLVSRIEISVDVLREYRTALITAAVTGKIDVRNYRPQTGDELEELETKPA